MGKIEIISRKTLEAAINKLMGRNDVRLVEADPVEHKWNLVVGDAVVSSGLNGTAILEDCMDGSEGEFVHIVAGTILVYEQWQKSEKVRTYPIHKNTDTCHCGGKLVRNPNSGESTTLVGFFSPPGHDHDDNCLTRLYHCSSCGQNYSLSKRRSCTYPGCDWVGKAECSVCGGGPLLDKWPDEV